MQSPRLHFRRMLLAVTCLTLVLAVWIPSLDDLAKRHETMAIVLAILRFAVVLLVAAALSLRLRSCPSSVRHVAALLVLIAIGGIVASFMLPAIR